MRHLLGTLLLCAALAACGSTTEHDPGHGASHGSDRGSGPASGSPTPTPSAATPSGDAAASTDPVVAILSASDVGGETTGAAVPLPDAAAVAEFVEAIDPRLGDRVVDAAASARVPEGLALHGQVVAVGCVVPESVQVNQRGAEVVVVPQGGPKESQIQCLVPVTTVALVLADG